MSRTPSPHISEFHSLSSTPTHLRVGRFALPRPSQAEGTNGAFGGGGSFAHTQHALLLMERVSGCVALGEPVLLVGETGTGKTTAVQQLAASLGHTLVVHNLNQQSDSSGFVSFRALTHSFPYVTPPFSPKCQRRFCLGLLLSLTQHSTLQPPWCALQFRSQIWKS